SCVGFSATPVSVVGNQVVYNLGTVPASGGGDIIMVVQVDPSLTPGAVLSYQAQTLGSLGGPTLVGMRTTGSVTVQTPSVNLYLTANATATAVSGSSLTYGVTVYNNGNITAHNVTLTTSLPTDTTFTSASFVSYTGPGPVTDGWITPTVTP